MSVSNYIKREVEKKLAEKKETNGSLKCSNCGRALTVWNAKILVSKNGNKAYCKTCYGELRE